MNFIYRSFIYDLLYFMADIAIKRTNPCEIHRNIMDGVVCVCDSPCCSECRYVNDNGCTVKCLSCKLHLCFVAYNKHIELQDLLVRMKAIAGQYHLRRSRATKSDIINRQREV